MVLVFIGAPASGKGTISREFINNHGYDHLAPGDILRQEINSKSQDAEELAKYMNEGKLVPKELLYKLIEKRFKNRTTDKIIFDGFPRDMDQVEFFEKLISESKLDYLVVNIHIDEDVLINRIVGRIVCPNCGASFHLETLKPKVTGICDYCGTKLIKREDDSEETLKKRLKTYYDFANKIIAHFEKKNKIITVNVSNKHNEHVFKEILEAIHEH